MHDKQTSRHTLLQKKTLVSCYAAQWSSDLVNSRFFTRYMQNPRKITYTVLKIDKGTEIFKSFFLLKFDVCQIEGRLCYLLVLRGSVLCSCHLHVRVLYSMYSFFLS